MEERTFCKIIDADVIELLYLLHDELLLVDLDDEGGAAGIAAGEPELAQGRLELVRDVDCVRLQSHWLSLFLLKGIRCIHLPWRMKDVDGDCCGEPTADEQLDHFDSAFIPITSACVKPPRGHPPCPFRARSATLRVLFITSCAQLSATLRLIKAAEKKCDRV